MNNSQKKQRYVFREYPKLVTPAPGKPAIRVYNAMQEKAVMGGGPEEEVDLSPPVQVVKYDSDGDVDDTGNPADVDEHTALMAEAAQLGVKVDGNWSTKKLRKAVANARLVGDN